MNMRWLRYWAPALVWAAIISVMSTRYFGSGYTSRFILPVLHWLMPNAGLANLLEMHTYIRKSAHLIEYGVFTILFMHGLRAGRSGWRWTWVTATMLAVACYAALDEFHQAFVPGRGASVWDVALDFSGGMAAMLVLWFWTLRSGARGRN